MSNCHCCRSIGVVLNMSDCGMKQSLLQIAPPPSFLCLFLSYSPRWFLVSKEVFPCSSFTRIFVAILRISSGNHPMIQANQGSPRQRVENVDSVSCNIIVCDVHSNLGLTYKDTQTYSLEEGYSLSNWNALPHSSTAPAQRKEIHSLKTPKKKKEKERENTKKEESSVVNSYLSYFIYYRSNATYQSLEQKIRWLMREKFSVRVLQLPNIVLMQNSCS